MENILENNNNDNFDWDTLVESCMKCEKCDLSKTRTNVVVGVGDKNAEVLFIGEGPGKNEDLQGEPFVGRSGNLLDKMLQSVGLSRNHNIYIANMVKCRPPENRDPTVEEQDMCIDWLRAQVKLIKPKIIVCVGRVSAVRLMDPSFKVTKQHGEFFDKNGVLMMGTLHPAALLRNANQKPEAYEDFLKLRDKILEICKHTKLVYPGIDY